MVHQHDGATCLRHRIFEHSTDLKSAQARHVRFFFVPISPSPSDSKSRCDRQKLFQLQYHVTSARQGDRQIESLGVESSQPREFHRIQPKAYGGFCTMRRAFKFRERIWREQPYWLGQLEAREHGLAPNRKS